MMTAKLPPLALWFLQGETPQFDLYSMWIQMGWPVRLVVILMFVMSAWSIGVMIDRWIAFNAAKKQSRQFAPLVAGAIGGIMGGVGLGGVASFLGIFWMNGALVGALFGAYGAKMTVRGRNSSSRDVVMRD